MFKLTNVILAVALSASGMAAMAQPGIGRPATPKEIAAWDIDVRPDFKGIPKGQGSVALGNKVWDEKCASCHGTFGESMEVFGPIVGGTHADDIKTGKVKALWDGSEPKRSTLMKVASLSTIWDYINRAMPWNAPKTLTTDEVYGVVAYILNMGEILPDNFVLSNENIAEVQKRMPNRNGMISELDTEAKKGQKVKYDMWKARGKGDTSNTECMKDCVKKVEFTSTLPDYTCTAHGDLSQQMRHFGAFRGVDQTLGCNAHPSLAELNKIHNTPYTPKADGGAAVVAISKPTTTAPVIAETTGEDLIKQYKCTTCHSMTKKIVGPGFAEVAAKYKGNDKAEATIVNNIKNGIGMMPPHGHIKDADLKKIAQTILSAK